MNEKMEQLIEESMELRQALDSVIDALSLAESSETPQDMAANIFDAMELLANTKDTRDTLRALAKELRS